MTEEKTISRESYMVAFGLFTVARQRRLECEGYEREMRKALGIDEEERSDHLADAFFGESLTFDLALERIGIVVETAANRQRREGAP